MLKDFLSDIHTFFRHVTPIRLLQNLLCAHVCIFIHKLLWSQLQLVSPRQLSYFACPASPKMLHIQQSLDNVILCVIIDSKIIIFIYNELIIVSLVNIFYIFKSFHDFCSNWSAQVISCPLVLGLPSCCILRSHVCFISFELVNLILSIVTNLDCCISLNTSWNILSFKTRQGSLQRRPSFSALCQLLSHSLSTLYCQRSSAFQHG